MLTRVGQWSFGNPVLSILLWVLSMVAVVGWAIALGSAFNATFDVPASETSDGFEILEEHFDGIGAGQSGTIVFEAEQGADDPEVVDAMSAMFAEVAAIDGFSVVSPYGEQGRQQISPDGTVGYALLTIAEGVDQQQAGEIGAELMASRPQVDGLRVEIGGDVLAAFEPPESELIGLAFAVIVLILAFGSVAAMSFPVGTAVFGVGVGAGLITLLSHLVDMPDFSIQVGAMIGLGVGIDYALFIVTRYRDELKTGVSNFEAVGTAIDTAGRAVLFAGITVVTSLLGMTLLGVNFMTGVGVGSSVTVMVTMLASVTLLPAFLGVAGKRVEVTRVGHVVAAGLLALGLFMAGLGFSGALVPLVLSVVGMGLSFFVPVLNRQIHRRPSKPLRQTVWYRWSRLIQARPLIFASAGLLLLVVVASPVLGLRMGFSDEGNFPETTSTRQAYDLLAEGFGPGANGPFFVAGELGSPSDLAVAVDLATAISQTSGVQFVLGPVPNDPANPQAVLIQVTPTTAPQDDATKDLVQTLRSDVIPAAIAGSSLSAEVTGGVPANIDFTNYLANRMVGFFAAVLGLSFILLMMVFRSILVPFKAVIMNLLSIGSAYGVIVVIFQWGWLGGLIGVSAGPIEPFVPMMMFAIVFGLSMDYEVFLLSRIKEEYDSAGDPRDSVADGLAATARVISAAAAIMVVVFGAFLLEDDRILKMFGVGLSVAVFLDATIVRMLLVPATMQLLGTRNWWLPGWLDRILPSIGVEGTQDVPALSSLARAESQRSVGVG